MDIFDEIWHNHTEKILKNWNEIVSCDDTVIVNGDLSWGMAMEEAKPDLDFISALNGNKIIGSYNGILDSYNGLTVICELPEGYFVNAKYNVKKEYLFLYLIPTICLIISAIIWYFYGIYASSIFNFYSFC